MSRFALFRDSSSGVIDDGNGATVDVGGPVDVTDGSTTVTSVTEIDFTGATVTDGGGGTAEVNVTGGGGSSGEIAYTQITSPVNITGTTAAGATAVLSPGAVTFDGSLVIMSVFCPEIVRSTGADSDLLVTIPSRGVDSTLHGKQTHEELRREVEEVAAAEAAEIWNLDMREHGWPDC